MPSISSETKAARKQLIEGLNEDLSREYQAVIAYVTYSQVLKGAEYMSIAAELEKHAAEELAHALLVAKQIDYLGGSPSVTPKLVKTSTSPKAMLRFDLENENETVQNYRQRIRQCEALEEYAMAEVIRGILVQEQEHQIDLAMALGIDVPSVSRLDAVSPEAVPSEPRRPATAVSAKTSASYPGLPRRARGARR
jgi:bacterioferritin